MKAAHLNVTIADLKQKWSENMKTAEQKRRLNRLLEFIDPYIPHYPTKTRARDNCPAWVKEEALEKAKAKRKMRADKLRALNP